MGGETGCAREQHSRRSDGQKRCCIIFGNVFFFLSNTLIKNENYSLLKFCSLAYNFPVRKEEESNNFVY